MERRVPALLNDVLCEDVQSTGTKRIFTWDAATIIIVGGGGGSGSGRGRGLKHWRGLTTHKSDSSYSIPIWRKEVVGPSCRLICTLNISSSALGCTIFEVHQERDDKSHRHAPKSMKSWKPKGTRRRVSKSKGGGGLCMGLGGCQSRNYLWGTGQTLRLVCSADVFSPPNEMSIQFNQECVLSEML